MIPKITDEMRQKYTQYQINKILNHAPVMKRCDVCDDEFDALSYVFRPTAIYTRINKCCSKKCKDIFVGQKNKKIIKQYICDYCNTEFIPHKSKPHQKFCNHMCYTKSISGVSRPDVQQWIHKIKPPKNSISKSELEWLSQFTITHYQCPITIDRRTFRVDGYNEHTNTIYEYLGSFWHGNPSIYNEHDIHPVCKQTFGDLFKKTTDRIKLFENNGYTVVYTWSER